MHMNAGLIPAQFVFQRTFDSTFEANLTLTHRLSQPVAFHKVIGITGALMVHTPRI